jgi:putative tricarboxylic transport membrane protein
MHDRLLDERPAVAPLVLGLVLGDLMEKGFRRGLVLSDGDLAPFFVRPICVVLWVTILLVILAKIPVVQRIGRQLTGRAAAPAG